MPDKLAPPDSCREGLPPGVGSADGKCAGLPVSKTVGTNVGKLVGLAFVGVGWTVLGE